MRARADGNHKVREDHGVDRQVVVQKQYAVSSRTGGSEKATKLGAVKSKDVFDWAPKRRSTVQRSTTDNRHTSNNEARPSEEQVAVNGTQEKGTVSNLEKREKNGACSSKGNLPALSAKGAVPTRMVRKKRTVTVKTVVTKELPILGSKRKRGEATSGLARLAEKVKNVRAGKVTEKSDQKVEEIPEPVKIPKLRIMLSQKEIREDFMKISGRRPPSKPKRHSVQLWGLALCANLDLCTSRIY